MYAIYLSHIRHQFPPSNNSQISSNTSAFQIHVLFFIFIIYNSTWVWNHSLGMATCQCPPRPNMKGPFLHSHQLPIATQLGMGQWDSLPLPAVIFNSVNLR